MIRVVYHHDFFKRTKKLPEAQQRKLAKLLVLLKKNPYNPQLHTKHLSSLMEGLLSFRITRDWLVNFQFISDVERAKWKRVAKRNVSISEPRS